MKIGDITYYIEYDMVNDKLYAINVNKNVNTHTNAIKADSDGMYTYSKVLLLQQANEQVTNQRHATPTNNNIGWWCALKLPYPSHPVLLKARNSSFFCFFFCKNKRFYCRLLITM